MMYLFNIQGCGWKRKLNRMEDRKGHIVKGGLLDEGLKRAISSFLVIRQQNVCLCL